MWYRLCFDVTENGHVVGASYERHSELSAQIQGIHVCSMNHAARLGLLDGLSELWEYVSEREGILVFPEATGEASR
jgi:hypothetical protein